jgi:hypothetical protein
VQALYPSYRGLAYLQTGDNAAAAIYEIVNQLNRGAPLITSDHHRRRPAHERWPGVRAVGSGGTLGLARSTLESKIRALGINKNRFRGRPAKQ